ncbi:MAG: TonB-dependent receptor [Bacteroidaceae bacterium]|nr:TonB-dependent receptor [Bacteroidaceae bacterium]
MRHTLFFLLLLFTLSSTVQAQSVKDSSDIYYRHLDLQEIPVTGLTGQTARRNTSIPVSIMSQQALRQRAFTNIIDAVSSLPGVAQISTGTGISKPVIRGLGYNRVVTVVDGLRQEGQQWGDEHGIEADPHAVQQVEVIKGPASLMYGSDAMAGVLILHPESVVPQGTIRGEAVIEGQSNSGLYGGSARLAGHQQDFVWNARLSARQAHAYKTPRDGYIPGSQMAEDAAKAMLGINKSWGYSHLTLSYYHFRPSMIEGLRDATTGELLHPDGTDHTYNHELPFQQIYHTRAVLDNSIGIGSGMLKAIVGIQQNIRKEFEESADEADLHMCLRTVNYDVRYVVSLPFDLKLNAGVGGMNQHSVNKGEEYLVPDYDINDIGLYATTSYTWKRWTFNGGARFDLRHITANSLIEEGTLRFDDLNRNFSGATGALGSTFKASDAVTLRLNIARGFRAPSINELSSNGFHEGTMRYEKGNSSLGSEQSLQADFGFDLALPYLTLQTAFFINRIHNYIFAYRTSLNSTDESGTVRPVFSYQHGQALLKGFEAGFDLHPIHPLHIGSAFSYVDARQLNEPVETRYLPMTPAPRLTAEIKWELTHNGDHHEGSSFQHNPAKHWQKWHHTFDNAFVCLEADHNFRQNHYYSAYNTETSTPAYTLFNFSLGSDLRWKHRTVCHILLSANNIFNISYVNHLSRLKYVGYDYSANTGGIDNPGRNITLRLRFPFNF